MTTWTNNKRLVRQGMRVAVVKSCVKDMTPPACGRLTFGGEEDSKGLGIWRPKRRNSPEPFHRRTNCGQEEDRQEEDREEDRRQGSQEACRQEESQEGGKEARRQEESQEGGKEARRQKEGEEGG